MLGIFKTKAKDKTNAVDKNVLKDDKKYSLKKSKSQDKNEKESKKEKLKEERNSRFSFRRSKSLDKKRTKNGQVQKEGLFTVSSTPSLLNEKDVSNELQKIGVVHADEVDRDDESESQSQSSYTVSSSDITTTSDRANGDSVSSSSTCQSISTTSNLPLDKSDSSLSSIASIISDKYLQNCKTYPRKAPVFENALKSRADAPVSSSYSYSVPMTSPYVVRKTHSQPSISDSFSKPYTHSTIEGCTSMLSTPSSSTSSLSSITGRPISPSGRRTPPGPKLGTGGLIPSSPTAIRKTIRTNIKTNPTVSPRKSGTFSHLVSSGLADFGSKNHSLPLLVIEQMPDKNPSLSHELSNTTESSTSTTTVSVSQLDERTGESVVQENLQSPPHSPLPSVGRTRHSVSSMQSLESIPEIETDLPSESNEKSSTNPRKNSTRKLPPKINSTISDGKCKGQTSKEDFNIGNSKPTQNVIHKDISYTSSSEPSSLSIVTKKPPLVSKKSKESSKPFPQKELKDISKIKLSLIIDSPTETEQLITKDQTSKHEKEETKYLNEISENEEVDSTSDSQFSKPNQSLNENNCDMKKENYMTGNNEPATHVIFRIPFSSSSNFDQPIKRRATSLEIIPNSTSTKFSNKNEAFPRSCSSSPIRSKTHRRSLSMTRILPKTRGTDARLEIPITIEELKKQAENFSKSLKIDNQETSPAINKLVLSTQFESNSYELNPLEKSDKNTNSKIENTSTDVINSCRFVFPEPECESSEIKTSPSVSEDETESVSNEKERDENPQQRTERNETQNTEQPAEEKQNQHFTEEETKHTNEESEEDQSKTESDLKQEPNHDSQNDEIQRSPESNQTKPVLDNSETDSVTESYTDSPEVIEEMLCIHIEDKANPREQEKHTSSSLERRPKTEVVTTAIQTDHKEWDQQFKDDAFNEYKKELRAQESRYQKQIDDLTLSLSSKQQEVTDLAEELAEAREMTSSSPSELDLLIQIEDMKKQVKLNENMAESIKVELGYTRNETEIVKMKLESLDGELSLSKEQVTSLQEQNDNKSRDIFRLKDEEGKMRTLEEKVKSLEDQLRKSEVTRTDLQDNLNESEAERDEELKIVQDALDEAAQEREDLIHSFQKELQQLNATNAAREHQMLDDFEWKLREMQKDHKNKMIDKDKQIQSTLQRVKSQADDEDVRQKMEKMKNEINAKWEDKLRSECSRLKAELDELHSEEKHLAVESTKVQKKQEIQSLKASWELSQEEMTKEISSLKDSLTEKDAYYHKELESLRTTTDRDIWDLRMKLQKMNETSYDKQQMMEEKHRDQMERFRVDSEDRIRQLESRLAAREAEAGIDLMAQLEKKHKEQMAHLEEHHHVNMERLRDELECDKLDAIETARLMISRKREDVEENLKGQIATHEEDIRQCRDETELLRESLSRRDETVRSLREELERHQDAPRGYSVQADHAHNSSATPPTVFDHAPGSALNSSQFSLASSSSDSQGSRTSQDRYYLPENTGVLDEDQRTGNNTGLLGKVFGGGWFAPTKGRRGSTPLSNKKAYGT